MEKFRAMEDYLPSKLKRKELEDVNNDFSDFSLSSPARKIRRLDCEVGPIIEEEECEVPTSFVQTILPEQGFGGNYSRGGLKIEELPSNEERAIVLFKPVNATPFTHSPSNFSVSIDPHLVSVFKNQALLSSQSNSWSISDDKKAENDNSGGCLAVVPWVPSQFSAKHEPESIPCHIDNSEMMDTQEVEEAKMDVEDGTDLDQNIVNGAGGTGLSEGLHQWQQQQHCLIPQFPQNTTAPIVWYR